MNLSLQEKLRFQKQAGIITLSEYNRLMEEDNLSTQINNFMQNVKQSGADINNNKVQLDILNKFIDSDFDINSINPKEINEYDENLNEDNTLFEAEALLHAFELAHESELGEGISHVLEKIGFKSDIIKKAISLLKKLFSLPSKMINKLFFHLARLCGADIERASNVGNAGVLIFALICLCYGIYHFPSVMSGISLAFGAGSFVAVTKSILLVFGSLVKSISSISNLWKQAKTISTESEDIVYTSNDFLKDIEPEYKNTKTSNGSRISTKWVYGLKDWYEHLEKEEQPLVSKALKNLSTAITSKENIGKIRRLRNVLRNFEHGDEDVSKIFDIIVQSFS